MKYPLEIFYTGQTGWMIRASRSILRCAFVFELAGEILTNAKMIVNNPRWSILCNAVGL
jgi:hypothetical protein